MADPHDRISKHHRWGPLRLTPAEVGRKLGVGPVRDLRVVRGPSGRATAITLLTARGKRTVESQDFRRALDLRSTWLHVRVLRLEPVVKRVARARPTVLRGFVRGLARVKVQQQVGGGAWRTVRPVKTHPDGRFTVTVKPRGTTSYRLSSRSGSGATITLKTR